MIGADHVTLDLNGHTVDGQGAGTGVSAASRRDVTVVRGAIQGFAEGVALNRVEGATLRDLGLGGNGISCTFSEGCTIEGNAVYGAGIAVVNTGAGMPSSVRRNVVRGADGAGITVNFTATETTVSKNVVEDNAVGIEALHSSVGQLADNTIRSNDAEGILGSLGGDTVIKRNLIWRNGGDGLSLDHFVDVRIFSNYIARNRANGMRGETLARPLIEDNVVSRNLANGILLDGVAPDRESTSFAQLTGNVTSGNALDGIALTSATHDINGRGMRRGNSRVDRKVSPGKAQAESCS